MSIRNDLLEEILAATGGSSFNPTTGMVIERTLDALSVATTQSPTGLGTANSIQIEFGPAVNTVSDPASTLADGTVNLNLAGTYRIKLALQFGRTGSSGTSILLFRVTDGLGNQLGRSISALIDNPNTDRYLENDTWLTVPDNTVLKFEIMRDSAGNNSGGLLATVPTVDGGNEWNVAPSAAIRIERWVPSP